MTQYLLISDDMYLYQNPLNHLSAMVSLVVKLCEYSYNEIEGNHTQERNYEPRYDVYYCFIKSNSGRMQ